jgi:hypothetical protein
MSGFIKDAAQAGIDIGKDIFLAISTKASPDSPVYTTWIVHLQDSAKFIAFLRNQGPGLRVLTHPGRVRSATKGNMSAAWNKDLAVIVAGSPVGSPDEKPVHNNMLAAKKAMEALAGFGQSFYTSDPVFMTGFSDDADVHVWAEQGQGLTQLIKKLKFIPPAKNPTSQVATDKLKNKTLSSLRFGMGRITLQSHIIPAPGAEADFARFKGRPMNTDLLARIPKGNLLGFLSFSIDLPMIDAALNKAGFRNKVDSQLAKKHLSLDTILNAFKGDFLLAAMEPDQTEASQKPKVPLYFAATIADLASYNSIAAKVRQMQDSIKPDSSGQKPGLLGKMKTATGVKDNIFVMSLTQPDVDAYLGNTEKRSTDFVPAAMKENPFGLLIDFKTLADFLGHISSQPAGKDKKMLDILNALDTMIITGGMKNGAAETFFELKMTDQGENSLKTLVKLMH